MQGALGYVRGDAQEPENEPLKACKNPKEDFLWKQMHNVKR